MSSYNIAMVFAPCLIRPINYQPEDLQNHNILIEILVLLLNNHLLFFPEYNKKNISSKNEKIYKNFLKEISEEESKVNNMTSSSKIIKINSKENVDFERKRCKTDIEEAKKEKLTIKDKGYFRSKFKRIKGFFLGGNHKK